MRDEILIVCSKEDPASMNIAGQLAGLGAWEDHDGYLSLDKFRLIIHTESQIALRNFDSLIEDLGLGPKLVVFASRHKAKEEIPWLGGHFTGSIEEDEAGNRRLSAASPWGLRSFIHNITREAPEGFRTSAEATHHGPIDMTTPSFFAEIGSSDRQWSDPVAGRAVASSILGLEAGDYPVFLGVGGGHYVPRQTSLMLETEIAFGHLFSSYQAENLDMEMLREAIIRSGACYAYLDRKSLGKESRNRISRMLEEIGVPTMRGRDISLRFPGN